MTEVAPIVTHHQATVGGKTLKYAATTGRLPIKRGDGKIEAEMFFVAYTLDGQDNSKRPMTFAFNGGPGSATVWLHMGALGPKRVALPPDGFEAAAAVSHGGQPIHAARQKRPRNGGRDRHRLQPGRESRDIQEILGLERRY